MRIGLAAAMEPPVRPLPRGSSISKSAEAKNRLRETDWADDYVQVPQGTAESCPATPRPLPQWGGAFSFPLAIQAIRAIRAIRAIGDILAVNALGPCRQAGLPGMDGM